MVKTSNFVKIYFILMMIGIFFKPNIVKADFVPLDNSITVGNGIQQIGASRSSSEIEGWHWSEGYWKFTSNLGDGSTLNTVQVSDSEFNNASPTKNLCIRAPIPTDVQKEMNQYGGCKLKVQATPKGSSYGNNNFSIFYLPDYHKRAHAGAVLSGTNAGQINSAQK